MDLKVPTVMILKYLNHLGGTATAADLVDTVQFHEKLPRLNIQLAVQRATEAGQIKVNKDWTLTMKEEDKTMLLTVEETIARYIARAEIMAFGAKATKDMCLYWVENHDEYLARAKEIMSIMNNVEFRQKMETELTTASDAKS